MKKPNEGIFHSSPAALTGFSRRELLARSGTGLGMMGLAGLLGDDSLLSTSQAADAVSPLCLLYTSPSPRDS